MRISSSVFHVPRFARQTVIEKAVLPHSLLAATKAIEPQKAFPAHGKKHHITG
jgi:hypothetical protein